MNTILYLREVQTMEYEHVAVMLNEVLKNLGNIRGGYFIDCTLGGGGYTSAISERTGSNGVVLGIDLDDNALENTKKKKLDNVIVAKSNYRYLDDVVRDNFPEDTLFDGIVMDLGLSSYQLADRERGFSFKGSSPLDMSFEGRGSDKGTGYIVNRYKEEDLVRIFRDYGEERFAKNIASSICEYRKAKKIETTEELVNIIEDSIPKRFLNAKTNPATKVFQALRIETNEELESLKEVLPQAMKRLKKGGRLVIVSFHSLEDRIVKHFFKEESKDCVCPSDFPICQCDHKANLKIISKKPILPTEEEIKHNPRSRSAKLRVAEKI